jgi:hypothetical protein
VPSAAKMVLAIIDDDIDLRAQLVGHFAGTYAVAVNLGDPGTLKVLRERPPAAIILDLFCGS